MDWPAHHFANAMQLVAANIIKEYHGVIKMRRRRRSRTLTDIRLQSHESVSIIPMLITIGIFVDFCDSWVFHVVSQLYSSQ